MGSLAGQIEGFEKSECMISGMGFGVFCGKGALGMKMDEEMGCEGRGATFLLTVELSNIQQRCPWQTWHSLWNLIPKSLSNLKVATTITSDFTASQEKRREGEKRRERARALVLSCSRAVVRVRSLPRIARSINRSDDLEEMREMAERAGSAKKMRSSSSKDGSSDFVAQFDSEGATIQMTESMSQDWTDEKHSLYLNSMEASFVRQLNSQECHSVSLFCQRSNLTPLTDMPDSSSLYSNANNSIYSEQFKWIQHFRSAGKQEVVLSDRHENCFTSTEAVDSKGQKRVFHGAGMCSKEVHVSMYHHHSVDDVKESIGQVLQRKESIGLDYERRSTFRKYL
ncbi:hypothetical protein Sjap_022432 [Stephania japonica]|uniref:Uncharacterized protein n=1 Tax=Stephania japonica TaxID=461633 RepID=A0AAP0ERH3_9MAGN